MASLSMLASLSLKGMGNYNQHQPPKATTNMSWWKRIYIGLLSALVIAAFATGTALLMRRSASPGLELVLPTSTPTPDARAYVSGAVNVPGVYPVRQGDRLNDLVERAGGALGDADLSRVNLAQRVRDQDHFHIPRIGESMVAPTSGTTLVNVNTASVQELMALPGIGEVKAKAIVGFREIYGPFQTKDELMNVDGIGPSIYAGLRDLITVGVP